MWNFALVSNLFVYPEDSPNHNLIYRVQTLNVLLNMELSTHSDLACAHCSTSQLVSWVGGLVGGPSEEEVLT